MRKLLRVAALSATVAVAVPTTSWAVDGVVLIDQNRAATGGVTAGDTAGFPVLITQPGSYRLSSNLTAPRDVAVILIASSNVDLDLNGFTIACSVQAATHPQRLSCVEAPVSVQNVGVYGGKIQGTVIGPLGESPSFCAAGLDLVRASRIQVHDIIADSPANCSAGMSIGDHAVVRHNVTVGFDVTCPSLVIQNVNSGGQGQGGTGCVYLDNVGITPF